MAGCGSAEPDRGTGGLHHAPRRPSRSFAPGAAGVGDPYFPSYGNGGYDVARYTVKVRYDPATDKLTGTTTVRATATADLSDVQPRPGRADRQRGHSGRRAGDGTAAAATNW